MERQSDYGNFETGIGDNHIRQVSFMPTDLNSDLIQQLSERDLTSPFSPIFGKGGVTSKEIDAIEAQLGFKLPSDMRFLLNHLDDSKNEGFSWKAFELQAYEEMIEWVKTGLNLILNMLEFG